MVPNKIRYASFPHREAEDLKSRLLLWFYCPWQPTPTASSYTDNDFILNNTKNELQVVLSCHVSYSGCTIFSVIIWRYFYFETYLYCFNNLRFKVHCNRKTSMMCNVKRLIFVLWWKCHHWLPEKTVSITHGEGWMDNKQVAVFFNVRIFPVSFTWWMMLQ